MQKVKLLQTRAERIIAIWRMRMMIRWWWWCIHVAIAIRRQGESEPAQRSDNGQRLPRRNIYVLHFMKRQAYLKNYFQNKIWNYNKRIYVKPGCVLSPSRGPWCPTGQEVRYLSSSPVSTNRLIWEGNPGWLMAWHWTSGLIDHDGWATWQNKKKTQGYEQSSEVGGFCWTDWCLASVSPRLPRLISLGKESTYNQLLFIVH